MFKHVQSMSTYVNNLKTWEQRDQRDQRGDQQTVATRTEGCQVVPRCAWLCTSLAKQTWQDLKRLGK